MEFDGERERCRFIRAFRRIYRTQTGGGHDWHFEVPCRSTPAHRLHPCRGPAGCRSRQDQRHADVLRSFRRRRSAGRAPRCLHEHPVHGRDHPHARQDSQGLCCRAAGPRPHHRYQPADHLPEPGRRRGGLHGRGGPEESRRVRLFHGRQRRAAARHPPPAKGESSSSRRPLPTMSTAGSRSSRPSSRR